MGEIIFDDEIPFGDEIRLDGGWVDLISSAKQISSELRSDFIAFGAISLWNNAASAVANKKSISTVKITGGASAAPTILF